MLSGKGEQKFLTVSYEEDRNEAMEDRTHYTSDELEELDLLTDVAKGGGATDPDNWEVKQFPFPIDQSIRRRKKVDLREVDPAVGD